MPSDVYAGAAIYVVVEIANVEVPLTLSEVG